MSNQQTVRDHLRGLIAGKDLTGTVENGLQTKSAVLHSGRPGHTPENAVQTALCESIYTAEAGEIAEKQGVKEAHNQVDSTQVDMLFDVAVKSRAAEFFETALSNTVFSKTASTQPQPQQQLTPNPVVQPAPMAPNANPSGINGLHQMMQQFMPGATNPQQPVASPAAQVAAGGLSQPAASGAAGGKATALPGAPGHAATNVIDQRGALDPTGRTVDGNNSSTVKKFATLCGIDTDNSQLAHVDVSRILRSLGMPADYAVNKNQKQAGDRGYGYCPVCGAAGVSRSGGNSVVCESGHKYATSSAKVAPGEKQAMSPGEFGAKTGLRGGILSAIVGSPYTRSAPGGYEPDDIDEEVMGVQDAASKRLDDKPWYNLRKLNHRFIAPVMDFAGPAASIGTGLATGIGTGNPLAGMAAGGAVGVLAGSPRRWATGDVNNWATDDIHTSDRTPEHKQEMISRMRNSELPAMLAHAMPGLFAGGASGLGQMFEANQGSEYTPAYEKWLHETKPRLDQLLPNPQQEGFRGFNPQHNNPYPPGSADTQAPNGVGDAIKNFIASLGV